MQRKTLGFDGKCKFDDFAYANADETDFDKYPLTRPFCILSFCIWSSTFIG